MRRRCLPYSTRQLLCLGTQQRLTKSRDEFQVRILCPMCANLERCEPRMYMDYVFYILLYAPERVTAMQDAPRTESQTLGITSVVRSHLRSCAIGTPLSGVLAFPTEVTTCGVRAGTTAATLMVFIGISVTLNIFHRLIVIVAVLIVVVGIAHRGEFSGHVHLLALQKPVHDFADLQVSGAKPGRVASATLRLGLKPEQVSLGG